MSRIPACMLLCLLPAAFAQSTKPQEASALIVTVAPERTLRLQVADLENMPRQSVQVRDHDGNLISYTGVPLAELLRRAGAPLGENLRGAAMASYVLAEAADGYRVVFALAELDPAFTDAKALVAYAMNDKPLPEGQGPLRIVVPGEKRPARWIRMVHRLEVVKVQ